MTTLELKESLQSLNKRANELVNIAKRESRRLTDKEEGEFDDVKNQIASVKNDIKDAERRDYLDAENAELIASVRQTKPIDEYKAAKKKDGECFGTALRGWINYAATKRCSDDERQAMVRSGIDPNDQSIFVPMNVLSTTGEPEATPDDFTTQFVQAMKTHGSIYNSVFHFPSADGRALPILISKETGTEASLAALTPEEQGAGEGEYESADPTFGQVVFTEAKYTSSVPVTIEMMRNSVVSLDMLLPRLMAKRLMVKIEKPLWSGNGTTDILKGLLTGSSTGSTRSAIGYDLILDLESGIDQAYADSLKFYMNRKTYFGFRGLLDGNSRPLMNDALASISNGVRSLTLDGIPVVITEEADDVGSNKDPIVLAASNEYWVRDIGGGVNIFKLDQTKDRLKGLVWFGCDISLDARHCTGAVPPAVKWHKS